jgi:4-hydroxy-tetrahydrodipicolinate synthase
MSDSKFTGMGVAIATPFRNDGSIDFKAFENHINYLIDNKADYIVALGTTGESVTLSKDEKRAVIDFAIETIEKRVPLVVGMGGYNTNELISQIKSNVVEGIDAILSVAPYYNKPTQEGLYIHFKEISMASPVPVILYNIPGRTGTNIEAETILSLAADFQNIIGVKEASGDFEHMMKIIKNKKKNFHVISGDDLTTLPIVSIGGAGVISVIGNAFPGIFGKMVRLALGQKIEEARQLHYKFIDLINLLFTEGNPAGIKATLHCLNLMENNLRLPLTPVTDDTYNKIKEAIKKIK